MALAGVRAVPEAGRGAGGPLVAERLSDRLAVRLACIPPSRRLSMKPSEAAQ